MKKLLTAIALMAITGFTFAGSTSGGLTSWTPANQPYFKLGATNNQKIAHDYIMNNSVTIMNKNTSTGTITITTDKPLNKLEDIYLYIGTRANGKRFGGHLSKLGVNTGSYTYQLNNVAFFKTWTGMNRSGVKYINIAKMLNGSTTIGAFVSSNRAVKITSITISN